MILGNGYDRSLWFLLTINDDRDNFISMFKFMPDDFYKEIKKKIRLINKCIDNKDDLLLYDNAFFENSVICKDGFKFNYKFNLYDYSLTLQMSDKNDESYDKLLEMNLNYISDEKLLNNEKNVCVGSMFIRNNYKYNLILGDFVESWNLCKYIFLKDTDGNVKKIDIINVSDIPDRIYYSNLCNERLLVRKRG